MNPAHSLVKPTVDTPFHIDFDWWKENDNDWKIYLSSCLCQAHQDAFSDLDPDEKIDAIDPITAEVSSVDAMQHALMTHCSQQPDFVDDHTSLVDGVFRLFIANGNQPLTPQEISERINRPAVVIIKTLAGMKVYKGIRPCA